MKCYCCQSDLIWGGDEDATDDETDDETDDIVTNLSCPECGAFVLVYWGQKEKEEND